MMGKQLLSYIYPTEIKKGTTTLGQFYELVYENGTKVLNSQNVNYSFGSLHQVMLKGIIKTLEFIQPKNILMLGLGGGSAVKILRDKLPKDVQITAVEIDSDIIKIAKTDFGLVDDKFITIIEESAETALNQLNAEAFDFIIDDVFWDNTIPSFCLSENYLKNCSRVLQKEGIFFRNIMLNDEIVLSNYESILNNLFEKIDKSVVKKHGNILYICQK
ncbi:MAG: fused MFS/spermidine synthase [Bacteroidota bacterium]|nr:fused MFS/spermidine synthase [Bacteroidota bacterium]